MQSSRFSGLFFVFILFAISAIAQENNPQTELINRTDALNNQGVKNADEGNYAEAIELFRQAIKLCPDYFLPYGNLGAVYIRQEKFKEAIAPLKRAQTLDPKDAETYVQLGYALSRRKKYDEVIAQIEQAVRLNPQDSEVQFFLGQLYLINRQKQAAIAQYRKLSLLDSERGKRLYFAIYGNLVVNAEKK